MTFTFIPEDQFQSDEKEFTFIPEQDLGKPQTEESWAMNAARKIYQPIAGALNMTAPSLTMDAISAMATGESLSELEDLEERLPDLKKKFPHADLPEKIDREKYMQSLQEAQESFPTQRNIEKKIEEKTGAPLEAKTRADELFRLAGSAGKLSPGGVGQKTAAGVAAPVISQSLVEAGAPEGVADIVALMASNPLGKAANSLEKAKHPSGLTKRRYEGITSPKSVSGKVKERITAKTEKEFNNITNKLIEESQESKTYSQLKENPQFKQQVSDAFKEVEKAAIEIEQPVSTYSIKERLINARKQSDSKGFADSPYDKAYKKQVNGILEDIETPQVSAQQLVQQYRKNNAALSEHYDPNISRAANRAQKDALLDFNRSIAETIKKEFPDSEFARSFEFTNKEWSKIKDAEYVDKFVDDLFDGKIRYEKGKKLLERENAQLPFKRLLGEEGYSKFEGLINDLMSTESANKLLKVAESKGLGDLARYAMSYVLHPSLAYAKFAGKFMKDTYKALLDKPQLSVKWQKGIELFKAGNFIDAARKFEEIESQLPPLVVDDESIENETSE